MAQRDAGRKSLLGMKPLLMMRTKGLSGVFAIKHYGVPGLSYATLKPVLPVFVTHNSIQIVHNGVPIVHNG